MRVQRHYIEASGKLYDPTVPDDGAFGRRRHRLLGVRGSDVSARTAKWLFVNIQVPGITCAITGDWASLGL